jgi:hypothetical protein
VPSVHNCVTVNCKAYIDISCQFINFEVSHTHARTHAHTLNGKGERIVSCLRLCSLSHQQSRKLVIRYRIRNPPISLPHFLVPFNTAFVTECSRGFRVSVWQSNRMSLRIQSFCVTEQPNVLEDSEFLCDRATECPWGFRVSVWQSNRACGHDRETHFTAIKRAFLKFWLGITVTLLCVCTGSEMNRDCSLVTLLSIGHRI